MFCDLFGRAPTDFIERFQDSIERLIFVQQLGSRLFSYPGDTWNIVDLITTKSLKVDELMWWNPKFFHHQLRRVGEVPHSIQHTHFVIQELREVLVGANDKNLTSRLLSLLGQRGDNIVRLEIGDTKDREIERLDHTIDKRELTLKIVGHLGPIRLVILTLTFAERSARWVEDDGGIVGVLLLHQLRQHGDEAKNRIGRLAGRGAEVGWYGIVGSKEHIAAVYYDKSLHGLRGFCGRRATPSLESSITTIVTAILSLKNVSKVYPMGELEVRALDQVTLEVQRGELLMVLGQSGSGKSTLLNVIGGMDRPTSGEVIYYPKKDEAPPLHLEKAKDSALTRFRRTYVGFVFQFFNLIPTLTALENVQVATALNDRPGPFNAKSSLEVVGLGDRWDHFPSQLSGGQQQRVAIARALASNPDILLCDEPTGNLDSETGEQVLKLLTRVHKEYGKTVIMITHNPESVRIADRVIELKDGKVSRTLTEDEVHQLWQEGHH